MEPSSIGSRPRTVDNIGVDVSKDYAQQQSAANAGFIKDVSSIRSQTEISVRTAVYESELDRLLHATQTSSAWANFAHPSTYYQHARDSKLLSGAPVVIAEQLEAQHQKINSIPVDPSASSEEHLKTQQTLCTTLKYLIAQHRMCVDTNSKGNQYIQA